MTRIEPLEKLATKMVGDGGSPNLYFITKYDEEHGACVGVARSLEIAKGITGHYEGPVMIEDRQQGVVWENLESENFQKTHENPGRPPSKSASGLKNKLLR